MGLDMYLYAEKFISKYDDPTAFEAAKAAASALDLPVEMDNFEHYYVRSQCAYWRKANQIHNWFVTQCQNGVDECQFSEVEYDKLVELRDLCKSLQNGNAADRAERAAKLLPPASGFFFGPTDIDDWYWSYIDHTVTMLDLVLSKPEAKSIRYYYHSSW